MRRLDGMVDIGRVLVRVDLPTCISPTPFEREMKDVPVLDSLEEVEEGSSQQGTESWSEPCAVSFTSRTVEVTYSRSSGSWGIPR